MSERERPQDPAEGPDDPEMLEPDGPQIDEDSDEAEMGIGDIADAMPGAGRLNEDIENPGTTDPDLRTSGPAPLP